MRFAQSQFFTRQGFDVIEPIESQLRIRERAEDIRV